MKDAKMSKYNIASVGIEIPGLDNKCISIESRKSLSSFDIIIFQPQLPSLYSSDYIDFSNGGRAITGDGYQKIKKITEHWFAELSDALKQKKTVIILTTPNEEIKYVTSFNSPRKGEKTYYTGSDYLYNGLLPYHPKIREAKGSEIIVSKNDMSILVKQLYESCKDQTAYEVVFTEIENSIIPLLLTKTKQIIGALKEYDSGGRLIFWPNIDFDIEDLTYEKDDNYYWTKEANAMGKSFIAAIVSLHSILHSLQEPIPAWVSVETYITDTEKAILEKIQLNNDKQKKMEAENTKLHENLKQQQQLKLLLYAQGKELERAVNNALTIIGLKVKNYHFKTKDLEIDNLIDYNGSKIVGETEGKDNDAIAINKIRQLVSNKSEYYIEEIENLSTEPKGILFGNPERLKPITERTLDFTDGCKQIAITKNIALVKTQDLFEVTFYLKNNPDKTDYAKKCIEAMINTPSGIVQFPKPK